MEIKKKERTFVSEGLMIDSWEKIKPYFDTLDQVDITTIESLKSWLQDRSELGAVLEEDMAWRYIKMTVDTTDKEALESYQFFVREISPNIAPRENNLNNKMLASPALELLEQEGQEYHIMIRGARKAAELFREENIPLFTEDQEKSQEFGAISGAQSIQHDGKEITMQKAASLLKEQDPALRKEIFEKMAVRRAEDVEKLNKLYSNLIRIRTQIAKNAGFDNYRDYAFEAMGRFDYTVQDCLDFHEAIEKYIVPIVKKTTEIHWEKLGTPTLKPWDTHVDPDGNEPLKPFDSAKELVDKTISCFNKLDPFFGDCIATLDKMGHLNLESKKGKAPGGYNYPLYEIGVPFIFMNAVGTAQDLVTMVHEGGHAIHSILTKDLELTDFKSFPSEVAELASMSMELLSMEHWNEFYDEENLKRAKYDQLKSVVGALPWIAQVDAFQHWIYTHPTHSVEERTKQWLILSERFGTGIVDWSGFEAVKATNWQRQLHLFEVPFYYIEYGFAQLGAVAVWKKFKANPSQAVDSYKKALNLGYKRSIPDIYKEAGISFDFSADYVKSLAELLQQELDSNT